MQRVRIRWIARIGLDGSITHRFGSELDLRGFEQRVKGWLEALRRSMIEIPMNERRLLDSMRDVLRAEVRRREASGGGE